MPVFSPQIGPEVQAGWIAIGYFHSGNHPIERDQRKLVSGIASAYIGVNARKPDLLDTLGILFAPLIHRTGSNVCRSSSIDMA